jgi:chemotaxis protein CheX
VENKERVLDAFTQAVGITFREMAGLEVVPRDTSPAVVARPHEVFTFLTITSTVKGDFALGFSVSFAAELARRIFADSGTELNDSMIPDCVGEVANVVAGQAKTLLVGTSDHFVFSTPTINPDSLPHPEEKRIIINFASEIGEFILCLRFPS